MSFVLEYLVLRFWTVHQVFFIARLENMLKVYLSGLQIVSVEEDHEAVEARVSRAQAQMYSYAAIRSASGQPQVLRANTRVKASSAPLQLTYLAQRIP